MKGILIYTWKSLLAKQILLAGMLMFCSPVFASIDSVLILKSSENSFFSTSTQQLIDATQGRIKFKISSLKSLQDTPDLLKEYDLVITMGFRAAKHFQQQGTDTPALHSYITEFEHKLLDLNKNSYSLVLEQPLELYLKFIKLLLPEKKIGIIRIKTDQLNTATLKEIEHKLDITLNQHLYSIPAKPIKIVRQLLRSNDVLLSLPERNIYNRQSLKGILLTSYRQGKPVISYSPAHVKSGALAAIYASPENIGRQVASIINKFHKKDHFSPDKLMYSNTFNVAINRQVENSLQLKLPDIKNIEKALLKK